MSIYLINNKIIPIIYIIPLIYITPILPNISIVPIILLGKIALWAAALLTLYTGYDYLKSGIKHL